MVQLSKSCEPKGSVGLINLGMIATGNHGAF